MADDTDRSLVHALQTRDRAAWARAYDRHGHEVFMFVAHLLHGDRPSAEEIYQDTWLAALAGIDGFDARRGELRAWLFGIARRQVALHFRRRRRARPAEIRDGVAITDIGDAAILPDDVIGAIERNDAVRAALAELGVEARCVLLGKYVAGHSVNELARQHGRSPKAIESLLSRARARMRSLLRWYLDSEKPVKDVRS